MATTKRRVGMQCLCIVGIEGLDPYFEGFWSFGSLNLTETSAHVTMWTSSVGSAHTPYRPKERTVPESLSDRHMSLFLRSLSYHSAGLLWARERGCPRTRVGRFCGFGRITGALQGDLLVEGYSILGLVSEPRMNVYMRRMLVHLAGGLSA